MAPRQGLLNETLAVWYMAVNCYHVEVFEYIAPNLNPKPKADYLLKCKHYNRWWWFSKSIFLRLYSFPLNYKRKNNQHPFKETWCSVNYRILMIYAANQPHAVNYYLQGSQQIVALKIEVFFFFLSCANIKLN